MRAKEFTINIPINIKLNDNGDPEIDVANQNSESVNPVFTPPLQQELELKKAELGKRSDVISDLTDDDDSELSDIEKFKQFIGSL